MKNILATLAFYASNGGWHTYNKRCRATKSAIKSLEKRGYLIVNEFGQAKFSGKRFD